VQWSDVLAALEKDPSCFDAMFTAKSCCATGKTAGGVQCWSKDYTPQRCCINPANVNSAFFSLPNPEQGDTAFIKTSSVSLFSATETCAKKTSCFDVRVWQLVAPEAVWVLHVSALRAGDLRVR
jgi:hypothetical protein